MLVCNILVMARRILLVVDDDVFDMLEKAKGDQTWEKFFLGLALPKPDPSDEG